MEIPFQQLYILSYMSKHYLNLFLKELKKNKKIKKIKLNIPKTLFFSSFETTIQLNPLLNMGPPILLSPPGNKKTEFPPLLNGMDVKDSHSISYK